MFRCVLLLAFFATESLQRGFAPGMLKRRGLTQDLAATCRRRQVAGRGQRSGLAFVIPDVEWYDSDKIGWVGSLPQEDQPAHGLFEQASSAHTYSRLNVPALTCAFDWLIRRQVVIDGSINCLSM